MIQRRGIGNVVTQHGAIGSAIKSHTQTLKTLLTGRVPQLQCHPVSLSVAVGNHGFFTQEIGPDRGLVLTREFARRKATEQGGLADAGTVFVCETVW